MIKEEYKCKPTDYCGIKIRNNKNCYGCSKFKEMWARRLNENNYTYCNIYEVKKMKDCAGAKLDEIEGRYRCKYFDNWENCPHKTPNELHKKRYSNDN